jgi:hypothetical protein
LPTPLAKRKGVYRSEIFSVAVHNGEVEVFMRNKKKIYILMAVMMFVFTIQANTGIAAETPVFSLTTDVGSVNVGSEHGIKLHVTNAKNIYAFDAVISYNHELTGFVEEETGTTLEGFSFYVAPEPETEDPVIIAFTKMGKTALPINGDTDLFNINFKALKDGTAELVLESVKVIDNDGNVQKYNIGSKISVVYGQGEPSPTPSIEPTPTEKPPSGDESTPDLPPSGGSTSDIEPTPAYVANIFGDESLPDNTPVHVDTQTGIATVDLEDIAGDIFSGEGISAVTIPPISGVNAYTIELPADSLKGDVWEGAFNFSTEIGDITIPSNMLEGTPEAVGKKIGITISWVDKSVLSANLQEAIGDKPLVQLTLTLDGIRSQWDNPLAPITVSIPYTPTAEELVDPEHTVVWYIDGEGNVISVPNGRYNPETGRVTFTTTHFSYYAVAFVHKTFGDLDSVLWAKKPIEVMASKGIILGTGGNSYSPGLSITRADYLLLLVRTLGLRAQVDDNFDDVEPDAYYYEGVGIAKKLGITLGVGNSRFLPREQITRQDMMVLTQRALEQFKGLEVPANTSVLEQFADQEDIAVYAKESLAVLVEEGLILGSGGKMNPRQWTTRAEAAVFLYRVYDKY